MKLTMLFSAILIIFMCLSGCQVNKVNNSESQNTDMTAETIEESKSVKMNSVDYSSVYDSYLFDTLIETYGLSAATAENATSDNLNIPHNELLGIVSALVYDFENDGASELLVPTRESAGDYSCKCYLTLYAYESEMVVREDRILLDEYAITYGGEHGDIFELSIYGDTIVQSLETRRYASYGPDALCNEYTFIDVTDNKFSKLVLKANALQVENKNYGEMLYHCEELCRNSMYGGCAYYADKNEIKSANACINDMLSQRNFDWFGGIQIDDNQVFMLSFTKEPDVKICDYDRYEGFKTTDYTGFRQKALDAGYLPEIPAATEITEPSSEKGTTTEYFYDTYSAEMIVCKKKGEIRGNGVEGCIAVFDERRGDYSYTGTTLENKMQVVAVRCYILKGHTWYDLYDIDYNTYYGWVDEQYITFYDESTQTAPSVTTTMTTTITTTATTTTAEPIGTSWQAAYRIVIDNYKNSEEFEPDYMWDLRDIDGDNVPELFVSKGGELRDSVSLYSYDGQKAIPVERANGRNSNHYGSFGIVGILSNAMIRSGYHDHGVDFYTFYQYADHSVTEFGTYYNNADFAEQGGLLPDYKVNGEYVTPDFYHAVIPDCTGMEYIGRKYSFDDVLPLE